LANLSKISPNAREGLDFGDEQKFGEIGKFANILLFMVFKLMHIAILGRLIGNFETYSNK